MEGAYGEAFESWWKLIEELPKPINWAHASKEAKDFASGVSNGTWCRRFFISNKGYIGVAPALAAPGDRVAVLFGGKVPYILRQNNINESECREMTWTFIGDSYVHGIMHGEVLAKLSQEGLEVEDLALK